MLCPQNISLLTGLVQFLAFVLDPVSSTSSLFAGTTSPQKNAKRLIAILYVLMGGFVLYIGENYIK